MSKRVLLCLSHSIEEWQQVDLLHSLGYEVASLGAYLDPAHPTDDKRPPLPDVPMVAVVKDAVDRWYGAGNTEDVQAHIPDAILDWLGRDGILIVHHREERLFGQWSRIREWMRGGGRVIWRTVGQSVGFNERRARPYRMAGLERVAYSPREANIPDYTGHDALIRFWGHQDDEEWTGDDAVVINVSQHLRQREPFTNWQFWDSATRDLPRRPIGPGSEVIGGTGALPHEEVRQHLHRSRAFLFTGSQPASYTLGLVEALHAGIPVVSIGPDWMRVKYGDEHHTAAEMFEGHLIAPMSAQDPNVAHHQLRRLLLDHDHARAVSVESRTIARTLFDRTTVGEQWKAYLG